MLLLNNFIRFSFFLIFTILNRSAALLERASLRIENRNLILESEKDKDISFISNGKGRVNVNGVDVSKSYALIESVKPQLETLRESDLNFLITNLSRVVENVASESRLAEKLDNLKSTTSENSNSLKTLEESQESVKNDITNFRKNLTDMRTYVMTPQLRSLIANLTNAVNQMGQNGQLSGSSNVHSQIITIKQNLASINAQIEGLALVKERLEDLEKEHEFPSSNNNNNTNGGSSQLSGRNMRWLLRTVRKLYRKFRSNDCATGPCHNGGTCINTATRLGFACICTAGFTGDLCNQDVNECHQFVGTTFGCQNGGTCLNTVGSYRCSCAPGWYGVHCAQKTDNCETSSGDALCGHGVCINKPSFGRSYTCVCHAGYTNAANSPVCVDINECALSHCSRDPHVDCENTEGSFNCASCPAGYTGDGTYCVDINECEINNGGCSTNPWVSCHNTRPGRICGPCPTGYTSQGDSCTAVVGGPCASNPCHSMATCQANPSGISYQCTCLPGYVGTGYGPAGCVSTGSQENGIVGNPCTPNPCLNDGQCVPNMNSYQCICNTGFMGPTCNIAVNPCASNPCQNDGNCTVNAEGTGFTCICTPSYHGHLCDKANTECGGYISGDGGVISYPMDDLEQYHLNVSCFWVIMVNKSQVITLNFTEFHVEHGGPNCIWDYVQIHDGSRSNSQLIGRYCGTRLPGNNGTITSTHNYLHIAFKSDDIVSKPGFSFIWNATEPVCGGVIKDKPFGSIISPGYPGVYPISRDCYWRLEIEPGKRIQFVFATLQIENHPNCSYDYLKIRDGVSEISPIIGEYCSTQTPGPLTTSGSEAMLHFHSDRSPTIGNTGFHIAYHSIQGMPGCGGLLTEDEAEFSSPTLRGRYHNNLNCEWRIRVRPKETIELNFTRFALEHHATCRYDVVEIRDGPDSDSPLIGKFCSDNLPPTTFSTSNFLFVRFKADMSVADAGFTARYKLVCGGEYTSETGVIESPYFPENYPHDRICYYKIRQPPGKAIVLNFTTFDLEDAHPRSQACVWDYLEIRDGARETSPLIGHFCGPSHRVSNPVISSLNSLWLKFSTDPSVNSSGFSAAYHTIDISCGGILHELTGIINSPNGSEAYQPNADCTWVIDVPAHYVIQLTWHSFSVEAGFSCSSNYIQVFDNSSSVQDDGHNTRKYCGNTIPPIMTSLENIMTIHFFSLFGNYAGFSATYHALDSRTVCGGHYHRSTGVIRSPNYPGLYPHQRSCKWTIKVPLNRQILLNFTRLDIEGQRPDCRHDSLVIRNGDHETSPLITKLCGRNQTISNIISHGHILWLKFTSDSSIQFSGFELFWEETNTGCGGTLTSPSGEFASPGYPSFFDTTIRCSWSIRVNEGSKIRFHFVDLDLGQDSADCSGGNFVEVFDGPSISSKKIGQYCKGLVSLTSSSNTLKIRSSRRFWFLTFGRGFKATYSSLCSSELTGHSGVIESPNYPNRYPQLRNCTWTIKAPLGNAIEIHFSDFNVANLAFYYGAGFLDSQCSSAYVEVLTGRQKTPNSALISKGRFCGSRIPDPIVSGDRNDILQLKFLSEFSVPNNKFRLEWVVRGCVEVFRSYERQFSSPNYPNTYPADTQCEWKIEVPPGKRIKITLEEYDVESSFSATECTFDALKIYGGQDNTAPILLTLCHHENSQRSVMTQGNHALVTLVSDSAVSGRGFEASYTTIDGGCGGIFSAQKGEIHSPNYPKDYDKDSDCVWNLVTDENHVIQLELKAFDVEFVHNCTYDYLAIYDGPDTDSELLSQLCGNTFPDPRIFTSTSRYMTLRLKSDGSLQNSGFKAEYQRACGATIQLRTGNPSGHITSPQYPRMVTPHTLCWWHFIAPEGSEIQFRFIHLNLIDTEQTPPTNETCQNNYVQILNGDTLDSEQLGKYCGNTLPRPIFSSSNLATVDLRTNLMVAGTGFRIFYSSVSTSCGGDLHAESGEIASPNYPHSYSTNTECIWTINAGAGNRVQLTFETFAMEETEHCNTDYVEIHEKNAAGALLLHHCSASEVPAVVSATEVLWMKFETDNVGTAQGFLANFVLLQSSTLTEESGFISSPLYPHLITTTQDYEWKIRVPYRKYISFEVVDISVEMDPIADICYSSVVIYSGRSSDYSPILKTLCGYSVENEAIVTYYNYAVVKFSSNFRHEGSYFKLKYTTVDTRDYPTDFTSDAEPAPDQNCTYRIQLTGDYTTSINSPNYPENYPSNANCEWIIETAEHNSIRLRLYSNSFRLEEHSKCFYDVLKVYDGINGKPNWNLTASLCRRDQMWYTFVSSGKLLRLRFTSDSAVSAKGFRAFVRNVCGGVLTKPDGVIKTPRYPHNYSGGRCTWRIIASTGRTIQMRFDTFRISNQTENCDDDRLLIYNGDSTSAPFLGRGRYCGVSQTPTIPETTTNNALLIFSSNYRNNDMGFKLTYTVVSAGCGGHHFITSDTPTLTVSSPNFPHPPHPHSECVWIISGPPNKALTLTFLDQFDIGNKYSCDNAYVEVRDGGTIISTSLGRYCGNLRPNPIHSTSSTIYLKYFTDASTVHTGFKAEITTEKCGGTYMISEGTLFSPNYPDSYDSNLNCTTHYIGPVGHYLIFTFEEINIYNPSLTCNSSAGKLVVKDEAANKSVTICGTGVSPPNFETASNNATVIFTNSDSGGSNRKFRVHISSSRETCGGEIFGSGEISSPGYPHGLTHIFNCQWVLRGPPGSKINLEIKDIDLDRSNYHCRQRLRVYNGADVRLSRSLCRMNQKLAYNSSMNVMTVRLRAYTSSLRKGFKAVWNSDYEQECGGILSQRSGFILSPNYGNGTYNHSSNCQWTLNNPDPSTSTLNIVINSLHLEQRCYDNIRLIGLDSLGEIAFRKTICTGEKELSYILPYSTVKFLFSSDSYVAGNGFNVSYSYSYCGGLRTNPQSELSSPQYGTGSYPPNSTCAWLFEYSEGSQVELEFLVFRLENSLNHDFVKIYNGPSEKSPLLGHYSGTGPSERKFLSMTNKLYVIFRSDGDQSDLGFKAIAREHTQGCGGVYHGLLNNISSPNFESNKKYSMNAECVWKIVGVPGYQIRLKFVDRFDIEKSTDCQNDRVEIFSMPRHNSDVETSETSGIISLGRKCGKQIPEPVLTNTSSIKIEFRSNENIQGDGFKIMYDSKCGGIFTEKQGTIVSPNYHYDYPTNIECIYEIQAPSESYVAINFTSFSVPGEVREGCKRNSLTVMQKRSRSYYRYRNRNKHVTRMTLCSIGLEGLPEPILLRGSVFLNLTSTSLYWYYHANHPGRHWSLSYSIRECGGNVTEPQIIGTPHSHGNYTRNMNCKWDIYAPEGKVIYIKFQMLDLEYQGNCRHDYVIVYDEIPQGRTLDLTPLGRYCGHHTLDLPKQTTSSNQARVAFYSDYSVEYGGFQAAIQFSYKCGENINITSPDATAQLRALDVDNDGAYEPFLRCGWFIQGNRDMVLSVLFTQFDIEGNNENDTQPCPYDYIEIFDGPYATSDKLGRFCGNTPPGGAIVGTSNMMYVEFHSDSTNQSSGFRATVSNIPRLCGGLYLTADTTPKVLSSPRYPNNYLASIKCRWRISAPENARILLHVNDFNVENSLKCAKDRLHIVEPLDGPRYPVYNGLSTTESGYFVSFSGRRAYFANRRNLNNVYCGTLGPISLDTGGSQVDLKFISDENNEAPGFRLHYSVMGCNQTFETNHGGVSANWRSKEPPGFCYYVIRAEAGKFISLNLGFSSFYNGQNFSLKVFDGETASSNVLLEEKKTENSTRDWISSKRIYSTNNSLKIEIRSDVEFTYRFRYVVTDNVNGCGGSVYLTRFEELITSPSWPASPAANLTCIYTVAVPGNKHVAVSLVSTDFTGDCNSTYVELYDVSMSDEITLFSRFCGNDANRYRPHLSPYSRMIVKFVSGPEPIEGFGWRMKFWAGAPHPETNFDEPATPTMSSN